MIVTKSELIEKLKAVKGATMISLVASTVPKMRKTDNPYFGSVRKVAKVNGVLNFTYENSVNNQRVREGKESDFKADRRAWGERNGAIVENRGKTYLQFKHEKTLQTQYVSDNGEILPANVIENFLSGGKSKRQGLDKDVRMCNYDLDNIIEIAMGGERYILAK